MGYELVLQRQVVTHRYFSGSVRLNLLGLRRVGTDRRQSSALEVQSESSAILVKRGQKSANDATRRGSSHSIAAASVIGRPWK